jgi:uncharacterized protein
MTVEPSGRYLPIQYPEEQAFWGKSREHVLVIPECSACGYLFWPIGPVCKRCLSLDIGWHEVSGRGRINSYVVYWKGWSEYLKAIVPYVVVQVELDEGPRLTTNLVDCDRNEAAVGLEVEATWEEVTDEVTLLQFKPVR